MGGRPRPKMGQIKGYRLKEKQTASGKKKPINVSLVGGVAPLKGGGRQILHKGLASRNQDAQKMVNLPGGKSMSKRVGFRIKAGRVRSTKGR